MLSYEGVTRRGSREINEDAIKMCEKDGACCFVLCDGLGGHGRGEVASASACNTVCSVFEKTFEYYPRAFYAEAVETANREILAMQQREGIPDGMKTTLVSLLICKEHCTWCHIGDSRLYLFCGDDVVCRTQDHSVPQMLANSGDIKEKDIRFHPDRNRLLRALGTEEEPLGYEVSPPYKLEECQAFLLCSDGFWEYIDEKQMCRLLHKSKDATEWMQKMVAVVEENGAGQKMDNYSAITVLNHR